MNTNQTVNLNQPFAQTFEVVIGQRPETIPVGHECIYRKKSEGKDGKFCTVPLISAHEVSQWFGENPQLAEQIVGEYIRASRREFIRSKIDSHQFFNRTTVEIGAFGEWIKTSRASSAAPDNFETWARELATKALLAVLAAKGKNMPTPAQYPAMLEAAQSQLLWVKVLLGKKLPSMSASECQDVITKLSDITDSGDECASWILAKLESHKDNLAKASAGAFDFSDF